MLSAFWKKVIGTFTPNREANINEEIEEWEGTLQETQKDVKEIEREIAQCLSAVKTAKRGEQCLYEEWECLRMSCHDALENPVLLHCYNDKGDQRGIFYYRINDGALERVCQEIDDTDLNSEDKYGSEDGISNGHNEREDSVYNAALLIPERLLHNRENEPVLYNSDISGDDIDNGACSNIEMNDVMVYPALPAVRKRNVLDLTKLVESDFPSDSENDRMREGNSDHLTSTNFECWKTFLSLQQRTVFIDSQTFRDELFGATSDIIEAFEDKVFGLQLKLMELKALETFAVYEMKNVKQLSNMEEVDHQSRLIVLTDSVESEEK
eukprot:Tbor_TRINITY_DN4587_c0_g2::TRINITY_DN4587_c0_g2_i1::g.15869::m.15869